MNKFFLVSLLLLACAASSNYSDLTLPELVSRYTIYCKETRGLPSGNQVYNDCIKQYIDDYCKFYPESRACRELK